MRACWKRYLSKDGKMNDITHFKKLVEELKQLDDEDGYNLNYDSALEKIHPLIDKVIEENVPVELLHPLLNDEDTWSCVFALKALTGLRNKKSVGPLISFVIETNRIDFCDFGEEAMFALQAIGQAAVPQLISAVKKTFAEKKFMHYLVGAATEIKDTRVYNFMVKIVNEYLVNPEKYLGWFYIDSFMNGFIEQENKEALVLIRKVLDKEGHSRQEIIELEDIYEELEDPIGFKKRLEEGIFMRKLGRNEPCHCGSGIKYKKCCLDKDIKETGKPKKIKATYY